MIAQHTMTGHMLRAAALVSALIVSGQVLAGCCNEGKRHCCHHGRVLGYPEMWQPRSEVNWADHHTFHRPIWNNVRLDFCLKDGMYCGRAAANLYCQRQGFRYATQFEIDRFVGQTSNIGTGYMNSSSCRDGFRYIRCRN